MKIFLTIVVFGMIAILLTILYEYNRILYKNYEVNEEKLGDNSLSKKALIFWIPSKHDSCQIVKNQVANDLINKGYSVVINHPNENCNYDYREYDFICYITPVYFSNVSKAMCQSMVNSDYTNKKVAIMCVGKEIEIKKETEYMRSLLRKENVVSTIKVKKDELQRITNFINSAII